MKNADTAKLCTECKRAVRRRKDGRMSWHRDLRPVPMGKWCPRSAEFDR